MAITIEATYENGVLHLDKPLPFNDRQRLKLTIHEPVGAAKSGYGLIQWTGSQEDLDYLIDDAGNDPLEEP